MLRGDASEAVWRLCALEIEDEVPLSPREGHSQQSRDSSRGHFSRACVPHEVLQSVCRHGFIRSVMRHSVVEHFRRVRCPCGVVAGM